MKKVLSIIVPTYNMELYLDKCLSSLIISHGKMQYLEVLVINDGSKDRSGEIAHYYEVLYPQTFRVIDKENGNYGSCINRGLKEAQGRYIKILDADDSFDVSVFDSFISFLSHVEADLIISDYYQVDEYGAITEKYIYRLPVDKIFTLADISGNVIEKLCHQGVTYKTDNLRKIGYQQTEGISYTDNEWMFLPMINIDIIFYYPHSLYIYLRGRKGQTFDPSIFAQSLWMRIKVVSVMLDEYRQIMNCCTERALYYLTLRLVSRCQSVYYSCLIRVPYHSLQDLVAFDKYIQMSLPLIYDSTNAIKNKFGVCYIRCWRVSGYNINILALRIHRFFYKIRNIITYFTQKF